MLISNALLSSLKLPAILLGLATLSTGCTLVPIERNRVAIETPEYADCHAAYEENDALIKHAGVRDAQARQVHAFPFLRSNRFLSSLRDELDTASKQETWLTHLSQLDLEARQIEIKNLPAGKRPTRQTMDELARCRNLLIETVLSNPARLAEIRDQAVVPDSYQLWARTLGIYPVTSLFVLRGVRRLHANEGRHFSNDPPSTVTSSKRIAYGIVNGDTDADGETVLARDALGIPVIESDELDALFVRHSPIWLVSTRTPDDRIGTVAYENDRLTIDTHTPSVYTHLSFTRFGGDVLAQLNYTVWFSARPKTGAFDILGGELDGITWRVTLDTTGNVLLADAMHNCGCYYMALPTTVLQSREKRSGLEEPLWIPQKLERKEGAYTVIHISETAHYIRNVEVVDVAPAYLEMSTVNYSELRNLPISQHRFKSMFDPDGLITGSERAERWLLWPMGIASAGAMRQFGHHPIAFVGRRHFDDPDLLDRYFERAQ